MVVAKQTDGTTYISLGAVLTIISLLGPVAYGVGVYVGRSGLEPMTVRLESHENIEVHDGAVRRPVYEAEQRQVRDTLSEILRRLDRIEAP